MSAQRTAGWWLAVAGGVVATAAVIAAVVMTGSPAAQREARIDARRINDLQRLQTALDAHARKFDALPSDLPTLAKVPGNGDLPLIDPVSGTPYEYARGSAGRYRLCAVFTTDSATATTMSWQPERWRHGAGRHCFPLRTRSLAREQREYLDNPRVDDGP